jgi:hypothetical protein
MPSNGENHLRTALKSLQRVPEPPKATPPARDSDDWQQFIESELASMNRRLSAIEARATTIFYIALVTAIITVSTNADKAAQLIQALTK